MHHKNRRILIPSAALALSAMVLSAQGQDWPQWRGPGRDAHTASFRAPAQWPKELARKWNVQVGDGDSTPALAGDRIYVFAREEGQEVTRSLDAATGKEIWKDQYPAQGATGPAGGHAGPRSSPAVGDGKVVIFGVRGALSCLDAATGKVLWRKQESGGWPNFFTSSSPLIVAGHCIAQLGGKNNGAVVSFALSDGKEHWKWAGDGSAYASPVLAKFNGRNIIVAETDKNLIALDAADGKLLLQTPFAGKGMGGYNAATPLVHGATVIISGSGRGTSAMKLEMSGDHLVAKELWKNEEQSAQFGTPVLKDGAVYGISGRDVLFCLGVDDGKTAWTAPSGGKRGFGSVVDAGTVLFALTPSANLVAFAPDKKEFKQLASWKVADSDTYAYPVLSGSRIFIKDKNSLTCYSLQ